MWLLLFVFLVVIAVSIDYCTLQNPKPDQKRDLQDSSLIIFYPELISAENPEESKMYVVSEEVKERLVWRWWVGVWLALGCILTMLMVLIWIANRY
ncbi:MAG: hypothetical protein UR43_C0021G0006 [candidate division TM6 bacterium GW2011_GWF2_33_332]|nr:MAG: hypothetical protein UR43_C0021G0006 [candidate division TM6 bacterium GW2011_GWF2_33_332]